MNSNTPTDIVSFCFETQADHNATGPILIDGLTPTRSLTLHQFRQLVCQLIAGLHEQKIQQGQCILVHLENSILYPALFLAIVGVGAVYMGAHPASSATELEHLLSLANPSLIITGRDTLSTVLQCTMSPSGGKKEKIPSDRVWVLNDIDQVLCEAFSSTPDASMGDAAYHHRRDITKLLHSGQRPWRTFDDDGQKSKITPAAMFATSGTSGLPKAAILSHHALIQQHISIHHPVPYPVTRLLTLPLFHRYGALVALFFPTRYAQPLILLPGFQLRPFLSAIHVHGVTETYLSPAMVHILIQSTPQSSSIRESLRSLRYVCVGGAPIDSRPLQSLQEMLHPEACVAQAWGMTETATVFQDRYCLPSRQFDKGSVGVVLPGYQVRLVDVSGSGRVLDNATEIPGELQVRGSGLFTSYKGHPDPTDGDGWFSTGDVMYQKNGHYFLVGRMKEMIKVRGYQVSPVELEAELAQHPLVKDAAVIGVLATDGSSELPRAYVVPLSWAERPSPEDIYDFMRQRLAGYKLLEGGVVFVDSIPRNSGGKIRRTKLSELDDQRDKLIALLT
ncbi:unnamed protein product [Aspergillus oryzae var. brunneus]|uniref:Unnamed protein product n=1 Tax=Aspergillus oryzae var. brunneus TaxID=332754 RepID=A0ABQ6LG38_ASPOZ|nr:unnamed protein product [Aspergillus oryzae var. brunneus]